MIQICEISKSFGKRHAVKSISLNIPPGELHGLIGPDGAGKTTLFRILSTLYLPDEGYATIGEWDVVKSYKKIRTLIGYMPGRFSLYPDLTVEENLNFFATVFNVRVRDNYDLIKPIYAHIEPFKTRRAGALSGGMKQKLALSCALIHKPEVLLLNEPTTGVDAVSRREFWDMLDHLISLGLTILVSTPYMDEAERCHKISLIHEGELFKTGTPAGIIQDFDLSLYSLRTPERLNMLTYLRRSTEIVQAYPSGQEIHFSTYENHENLKIRPFVSASGIHFTHLKHITPGIEDYLLRRLSRS